MLKLIASDLDGTLLPPSKVMPEKIFEIIDRLYRHGVVFAPASGRQLPNLKRLFAPVLDKIAIIAENGGIGWFGGETVFSDPTPAESVRYALGVIRTEPDLYPVLSCTDCAYYEDGYERFVTTLKRSYSSEQRIDKLEEVLETQTVLKISVWDDRPAAEHGGIVLPPKIEGLRTMISGYDWLDVSAAGANKGKALRAIAERLHIGKSETAAFGDHMNDLEMLQASGQAFLPDNAFGRLKELGIGQIIPSNAQFGVVRKLEEILQTIEGES